MPRPQHVVVLDAVVVHVDLVHVDLVYVHLVHFVDPPLVGDPPCCRPLEPGTV